MNVNEAMETVSLSTVQRALDYIREKTQKPDDEIQLDFEFLVGSFFPNALENMNKALRESYNEGVMSVLSMSAH